MCTKIFPTSQKRTWLCYKFLERPSYLCTSNFSLLVVLKIWLDYLNHSSTRSVSHQGKVLCALYDRKRLASVYHIETWLALCRNTAKSYYRNSKCHQCNEKCDASLNWSAHLSWIFKLSKCALDFFWHTWHLNSSSERTWDLVEKCHVLKTGR